jgi:hypothetical protein
MIQYSAKLLFRWRPIRNGISRKRRVCEVRIVTFQESTPESALKWAKKYGNSEEYIEEKSDGKVCFEFVGVLELKDTSLNFSDGEVWSEIKEMVEPFERREKIIPKESTLDAIRRVALNISRRLKYY